MKTNANSISSLPPDTWTRLQKKTQIVVVGGGAGGLPLVRKLGAYFGRKNYDIILIDQNSTHIWKPLLHEVAAGALDANLDEVGYRAHAHRWGYRYFYGKLENIDRETRHVITAPLLDEDGTELTGRHRIRYDYLVLAVGAIANDFGTPGAAQYCMFLNDRKDADRFRQRLLDHCLRAARNGRSGEGSQTVRVVIVGAGATGVELAAELFNAAAALRFYGLEVFDEKQLKVTLVEASPRILAALPEDLAKAAHTELESLGVEVLTETAVAAVERFAVVTKLQGHIEADLIVWAAGVRGDDLLKGIGGLATNSRHQLIVKHTLQTQSDNRIFALGDCAAHINETSGAATPPRAQAAHQMASIVFTNIKALIKDQPLKPFVYRDKGSLVSLSRYSTIGSLMGNLIGGRMAVAGRLARFVYMTLYRLHLVAIHGWLKGTALIAIGHVNRILRPKLKLH